MNDLNCNQGPDYTNFGGIWPPEIISHMHRNFNREGAGYLGQCPKFDRIFFLMASLTKNMLPLLYGIAILCFQGQLPLSHLAFGSFSFFHHIYSNWVKIR